MTEREPLRCSFCSKTQFEVRKLIAGPLVFICNECVDLCAEIVAYEPFEIRRPMIAADIGLLGHRNMVAGDLWEAASDRA